jgi:hypothetical protein
VAAQATRWSLLGDASRQQTSIRVSPPALKASARGIKIDSRSNMLRVAAIWILLSSLSALCAPVDGTLVVASIRQYQFVSPSNIHLYLYGLDGKLKKQLTDTVGCDDVDPAFTYDGKSVFFTRKSTIANTVKQSGLYQIDIGNNKITPASEDDSYISVPMDTLDYSFGLSSDSWGVAERDDCVSDDGVYRMTQKAGPPDQYKDSTRVHLLSISGKAPVDITTLLGFMSPEQITGYEGLFYLNGSPFVMGPGFAAVFLDHHLDSTSGTQIWGLDLRAARWTKMSENGGTIHHPPGAAGVFFVAQSRYEPLGNTGKTVNCAYLEWWDAHLQMTRLGAPLSFFYSGSIYHETKETLKIGETESF